jgi:protein involved in polysaccharide export with SLBB domain
VPFAYNAYVLGAVNRPGNVMIKDNLTATQAVAMAGGVNPLFATNQIVVIRLDDKGQRTRIPIDLSRVTAGENVDVPLKENDIVFVQESGLKRFLFNFKALLPGSMGMGASVPLYP